MKTKSFWDVAALFTKCRAHPNRVSFIRLPRCVVQSKREEPRSREKMRNDKEPALSNECAVCLCRFECKAKQRCKLCCLLKRKRGTMWKLDFAFLVHRRNAFFYFHSFSFALLIAQILFTISWFHFFSRFAFLSGFMALIFLSSLRAFISIYHRFLLLGKKSLEWKTPLHFGRLKTIVCKLASPWFVVATRLTI